MVFVPPTLPTPPSILLLRALARIPNNGVPITDMLALAIGVRPTDLVLLLRRGLNAGYLRDDDGVLTLGERGDAGRRMPPWPSSGHMRSPPSRGVKGGRPNPG